MIRSNTLYKLIVIARTARKRIEYLSEVEGGPANLAGYGGVAARYVELLANEYGIYPEFVAGSFRAYNRVTDTYRNISGHTWIEHEGHIIDITATQFRNVVSKIGRDYSQKVYVCKSTNQHYDKELVGDEAKRCVRMWYVEPIDEICEKICRMN